MQNSDPAIITALSLFNFLIITILETGFLLYFRKKIMNSIESSSADIGLIASFIINLITSIFITNLIVQSFKPISDYESEKEKGEHMLSNNEKKYTKLCFTIFFDTIPNTFIIIFLSDIRIFTYYRNTKFYPIFCVALSRFLFYNLANISTILTYKYNPNFH